jgi:hypothetical protein
LPLVDGLAGWAQRISDLCLCVNRQYMSQGGCGVSVGTQFLTVGTTKISNDNIF